MGKGIVCYGMVPLASLHGRGSGRAISEGGVYTLMMRWHVAEIPRQLDATAME